MECRRQGGEDHLRLISETRRGRERSSVGLRRVAVDERPAVQRMAHAAHFVLDLETASRRSRVDDVDEAIFVLVGLATDEPALDELLYGPEKSAR